VEDGLSHNNVWSVMQDSRGFMWFGTNDGLNRFDGKTFKVYKRKTGNDLFIGNNFIHCIKEDSQGRFFVGTKNGLYQFDINKETFNHIHLDRDRKDDASINTIMEDPDGNIWLTCHGQGLYVLNPDLTVKKHYINNNRIGDIPSNFIWSIIQDYTGNIWLGSAGEGLIHFDSKKEVFTRMTLGITDPTIYSLYCDIDNNIWIGSASNGLYRYNYRMEKVTNYMYQQVLNVKSIIEYSDHELIMGCDKGLVTFNRTSETFEFLNNDYDNLTDNSIFSITKDKEGAFWIGTYFGGVNYFSPTINKFQYHYNTPKSSSKKNIISSFAEDEHGRIWVGTYNDGLSFFNSETSRFEDKHYKIGYHDIQNLLLDKENLYISLYGKGLSILNIKTGSISGISGNLSDSSMLSYNSITTIFKTSNGTFLLGTENGASIFDPVSKGLTKIDYLSEIPIKDIKEDYNGAIWFATHANGLLRYNSDGKWNAFIHIPDDPNSLATNNVNCIFQDSRFRIWVGTEGEGLMLFNQKNNNFDLVLNEDSGLPSNIIYSILDDNESNIWITTGGGLVKIDADLKTIHTFEYLGDIQKIRYNPKAVLRTSDNRLYFGGTNGFIVFNPKEITSNPHIPQVVITGFQISNKEVNINNTNKIVLNHNQSTFSFDFVTLSYLSPKHNKYAYILEGFDNDWNYVDNNKAYYMNIPAGEYVFRVKGCNNDGVWNEQDRSIIVKVKPSFWFTNYMIAIYILLIIGICTYSILNYKRHIESKNQEKLYKYKAEKEKEIYESKINFFTDIAHEIRTPISLIIAPLENILLSGDGTHQTKGNLEVIEINANRLLDLVNQLLDFQKIEEDMFHFNFHEQNVAKIIQDVYNQYYQNAKLNIIEMTLSLEKNNMRGVVDSEAIYKIISNLISNAIKYAKKSIEIKGVIENGNLLLSVKDDGIGMDKIYLDKIFEPFFQVQDKDNMLKTGSGLGLSLSQSLAIKHNGKISVESERGNGSVFTLSIPIVSSNDEITDEAELPVEEPTAVLSEYSKESGLKILVVEDNKDLRKFLISSLGENNILFDAENGVKALEIIEKENLDIIISDILMPEMNGLELCNAIKTNPAYSHIPLILLSAKTDTPTKVEGLKKGADAYLDKPFSIAQLKAQINSIIDNRNKLRTKFIKSPLQFFMQKTEKNDNVEFIEKLNKNIIENMSDERFTIDSLSENFFMSRSNFHKKIKNIMGITPNDYIKLIRLNQSAQLLATGKYKINEVCYMVGFNTPSYFSKCFYEHFGKLPKDFIQ
jgi:ligand-binding sensor domain-containing protein/DNA-binding response OmpR family regulator/nitrogen-specific signal transduction histidine kinase